MAFWWALPPAGERGRALDAESHGRVSTPILPAGEGAARWGVPRAWGANPLGRAVPFVASELYVCTVRNGSQ